jgi:glyceraldehyde 3-phosphate dehydrogenase
MTVRAAINGFGRTGRAAFRVALESGADIDWVAINDLADPPMLAQLLKYDTVYRPFTGTVEAVDGAIVVNGNEIATPTERDPAQLPWNALDVDVVIESTGPFRTRGDAAKNLEAGAKKVIVSAPAKEPDVTVVLGANFETYIPEVHDIVSNASCTTNCLAPVAKLLPVPAVSLIDLTVEVERPTSVDEVNAFFAARADIGELAASCATARSRSSRPTSSSRRTRRSSTRRSRPWWT